MPGSEKFKRLPRFICKQNAGYITKHLKSSYYSISFMNNRYPVLLFLAALFMLASCKDNDNVFKPVTYTDLTIVNASADTLNFYLNGTRQNNTSSLFPTGYVAHMALPAGAQDYQFKKASNLNPSTGSLTNVSVLFSDPLNLAANTYYSLYITGETADQTFVHADTLFKDTIPTKATIRFVHASPDAGNLDITVGDSVSFKNVAYKSTTTFQALTNGAQVIKIYQHGSSLAKVDTTITFEGEVIYTLFAKGKLNGTGNATFDVGVITN